MKLSKPKIRCIGRSNITDRFTFITDADAKLVIPVGPRFQAEVLPWTLPPVSRSFENSKWICTRVWPVKGRTRSRSSKHSNDRIGRGRPESCECAFPGSIECVRKHVYRKRFQLQIRLGPVFWMWKFDEMGEDVSKLWSVEEETKFEYIVKTGKNLLEWDYLDSLPGKSRGSRVSYYLNVYIQRRMGVETRSSCINIDTDDDDDDDIDADKIVCLKGPRKRLHTKSTYMNARH